MHVSTSKPPSQIKHVKKGDTVGYGRVGKVSKDKTIATIGIGYADGLNRKLSDKKGVMLVNGKRAHVMEMFVWTWPYWILPDLRRRKVMK